MKYFLLVVFLLSSCAREIKDNNLKLGTGTANDVVIEASIGNVDNPKLKYDTNDEVWKFSHDGTNFSEIGAAGGVPADATQVTNWDDADVNGNFQGSPGTTNAPTSDRWYIGFAVRHNERWITQEVWDFATGSGDILAQTRWRRQSADIGGVRTWGEWRIFPKSYEVIAVQKITTNGSGTWNRPVGTTFVKFIYCGGGGGGQSASTTGAGQRAVATGGGPGRLVVCKIKNPPPTINYSVGAGGGSSQSGSNTVVFATGCATASGGEAILSTASAGTGILLTDHLSVFFSQALRPVTDVTTFLEDFQEGSVTFGFNTVNSTSLDIVGNGSAGSVLSGAGSGVFLSGYFNFNGGLPRRFSGNGISGQNCSGGGGALNLASQGTARTGGSGGPGFIMAISYR